MNKDKARNLQDVEQQERKEVSKEKEKLGEQKKFLKELSQKAKSSGVKGKGEKKLEGRKTDQIKTLGWFEKRRLASFHKQAEKALGEYCKNVTPGAIELILMNGNLPDELEEWGSKFSKIDKTVVKDFLLKKIEEQAVEKFCFDERDVIEYGNGRATKNAINLALNGSFDELNGLDADRLVFSVINGIVSSPVGSLENKQKIVEILKLKIGKLEERIIKNLDSAGKLTKDIQHVINKFKYAKENLAAIADKNEALKSIITPLLSDLDEKFSDGQLSLLMERSKQNNKESEAKELERLLGPEGKDITNYEGLTKAEVKGLKLLTKLASGEELDMSASLFVANFLKNAVGNKKLNTSLRLILKKENLPRGCSKSAINFIVNLSYRSTNIYKLAQPHIGTLDQINKDIEQGREPEKKLQLNEYHAVLAFSKIASSSENLFNNILANSNIMSFDSGLKKLFKEAKQSSGLVNAIEEKFEKECEEYTTGSDILMKDIVLEERFDKGLKPMEFLRWLCKIFVSRYSHAAKIYKGGIEGEKKAQLSHVVGKYVDESLDFETVSYSHLFRMDVSVLIPKEHHAKLKEKYGDHWVRIMNEKFDDIQNNLHKKRMSMENDGSRIIKAGVAVGREYWFKERDDEKIHDRFYKNGESQKANMICSEFVANTTIAALVELNNVLVNELGLDPQQKPQIVRNPIGKSVRIKKITPEGFINILKKEGCLVEIDRPPLIGKVFANTK